MMDLRLFGRTGIQVSPLCLGAMMFGRWGTTDVEQSLRIIDRALDAGLNFIDTADVYGQGDSEEIVGKALRGSKRDSVVLATKVNHQMGEGPNRAGNSRRWIMQEVDASLRRLGTDWIDLYQVHRPDPTCDIEETLGALTDLVRTGKVRYIGSSTFAAHEIVEAQWASERRGLERFVCEQPPYSILVREIEHHVLPVCEKYRMGVITWSPLCAGWLTGQYRKNAPLPTSRRFGLIPDRFDLDVAGNREKLDAVDELAKLAAEAGLTLIQLALGFIFANPSVTSAIVGPRTMEHLEAYLEGVDIRLTSDVLERIDAVVPRGKTFTAADAR